MDKEISKEHLRDIALWDFDWKPVGRRLLSSEQNVSDIDNDESNEQNKRDKMLITWQGQEGPKATYKVLMETFHDLKYGHLAVKLMHLAGEGNNEEIAQSRVIPAGTKQPGQSCLAHHCGCNQCDLEKLIQQGCPNYCNTDLFPFLNTEALTEGERKSLRSMLDKQGKSMSREFDKIKKEFEVMMKKIDLSSFKKALLSISGFDSFKWKIRALQDRKNDIKSAKEHDELVAIIEDYITWFNCTLLKEIVKECVEMREVLTDHDSFCECFETYEKARILYCRRGIFECPSDLFSKNRQLESCTKLFCLLVNDDKIRNIENLDLFEGELCIIFGMKRNNIILCSIGKGCIELVYLLPSCVHEALFPLNKKQLQGLATIGVTAICIGTSYESINTLLENENSTLYFIASNNNRGHHDFKEKFAACREDFEILKIHCCSALRTASVEELTRCVAEVPQKPHYQLYILKCSGNLRQCSSVNEFIATLCSSYSNYLFYQLFEKVVATYGNEALVSGMEKYKDKITSITTKTKVEELNDTRSYIIHTTADCEVEIVIQIPFSCCTINDIEDVRDEIRRISYMFEFCHTLCGVSGDSDTTTTKWVIPKVYSSHLQVDLLLSTIPLGKHFVTKKDAPWQLLTAYGVLKICVGGLCVFEYDPNNKKVSHLRRSILKQNITTNRESQFDHLTRPDDLSFRESNITRVLQFSIDQWLEFALRLGLSPQDIADCWSAQTSYCNFPNILLKKWLSTDDNASWYTLMTIVKPMLPPACDYADTIVQQYSQITEVNEKELKDLQETIPSIVRLSDNVVEDVVEKDQVDVDVAVEDVAKAVDERLKAIEEVLHASHEELKRTNSEEYWKRQQQLDEDLIIALSRQDAKIERFIEKINILCSDLYEQDKELQQLMDKVTEDFETLHKFNNNIQLQKAVFEELKGQFIRLQRLKSQNAERLAALTSIPSKLDQLQQDAKKNHQICENTKMNRYILLQKQVKLLNDIDKQLGRNEHGLSGIASSLKRLLQIWKAYFYRQARTALIGTAAGVTAATATAAAGAVLTLLTFGTAAPLAAIATVAATSVTVGAGVAAISGYYSWTTYEQTGCKNVDIISEHVKSTHTTRLRLVEQTDQIQRLIEKNDQIGHNILSVI